MRKRPDLSASNRVYFNGVSEDDGLCGHIVCVHEEGTVDTSDQTLQVRVAGTRKKRRTVRERREIVEETPLPGASASRVARRHDVNNLTAPAL